MILYFLLVLCNLSLVHLKLYPEDTTADRSNSNVFNPMHYALKLTAHFNNNDSKSTVYENSEIYDYSRHFDKNRLSIFLSRQSPNPDEYVHYTKRFEGKMGEETSNGIWKHPHQESFTFKIDGKQYLWGQSVLDQHSIKWFIHELLPDGRMGDETDRRMVADYYRVVFPFNIEGRQFFYGHNIDRKVWFIRELLPGGRIGKETDRGSWNKSYAVSFPFTIDGRHYLYGHQISDGRLWFFKELLANGKMGPLSNNEDIVKKHVNDFQALFATFIDKNLFIQELPGGGLFAKVIYSPPFKIDGKLYFYEHSMEDAKHWSITELIPNSQMDKETDRGVWNDNYQVVVPYNIKEKQFLYFHCQETKRWGIRSLH